MGIKGDKLTQDSVTAAEELVNKLESIGGISSKRMFGGHGIFHDGKMFCIVDSKGQCFLKADETNKSEFEEKDSFQHSRMPYFSLPDEVMNNSELLVTWAKKSIAITK
jgi:DNA transformation protein and related proteins